MKLKNYLKKISDGEIPSSPPEGFVPGGWNYDFDINKECDIIKNSMSRHECTKQGLWTIIDKKWTKILANLIGNRDCLEIMAGSGHLAKALSEHNVSIVATDDFSWKTTHPNLQLVYSIKKMEAFRAVKFYKNKSILIVSWPPYNCNEICDACVEWGPAKPIIFIGEAEAGCCASDKFWKHFEYKDVDCEMASWTGIHDKVMIGNYIVKDKEINND